MRPIAVVILVVLAGCTPDRPTISLSDAAMTGNVQQMRAHLHWGCDVNARDSDGWTPLYSAASTGHADVAKLLLDASADVNGPVKNGVLLDKTGSIFRSTFAKLPPLLATIADMKARNRSAGWTPLHGAAFFGHADVAKVLLDAGADVNVGDADGRTPLRWATNGEIAKILLAAGADAKARNAGGWTPLHETETAEVAKALLDAGADVHARLTDGGGTPLFSAALTGHTDVAKVLLGAGADVDARDENGMTPLCSATIFGYADIAKILLSAGADVNTRAGNGSTPLYGAAFFGQAEAARVLLDAGADVNARDKNGWTPLHWAESKNNADVADLLRAHGGTE